jgi:hypothetical protein
MRFTPVSWKLAAASRGWLMLVAFYPIAGIAASTAPPQLFGKSLTLAWQTNRVEENLTTSRTRQYGASAGLKVYVSSKGRIFTEKVRGQTSKLQEVSSDSGDNKEVREWRVEGHSLVAYHTFKSGVRRMVIDFDSEYRTRMLKVKRTVEVQVGVRHVRYSPQTLASRSELPAFYRWRLPAVHQRDIRRSSAILPSTFRADCLS